MTDVAPAIRYSTYPARYPVRDTDLSVMAVFGAYLPPGVVEMPNTLELMVKFDPVSEDWFLSSLGVIHEPGQPAIKSDSLRQIPTEFALRAALAGNPSILQHEDGLDYIAYRAHEDALLRSRRPDGPTPANLYHVAEIYRAARILHQPPIVAVQEAFGLPNRSASHWVKLARQRGQLRGMESGSSSEV